MQVKGSAGAMRTVKKLQHSMVSRGAASSQALVSGLKILLETDLRDTLRTIERPLSWYLGGKDSLVPVALAQQLQENYYQSDVVIDEQASHAPFISHSDAFIQYLISMAEVQRDS